MESTNNSSEPAAPGLFIKQEYEPANEANYNVQIKHETEDIETDNPFENLQIEIKQETNLEKDPTSIIPQSQSDITETNEETTSNLKQELTNLINSQITIINVKNETTESILPNDDGELNLRQNDGEVTVKDEIENVADYSYPSFDDSMDSSEAAALSYVEACLSEDVQIKTEDDVSLFFYLMI